jgi:predicted membrane-bound spermidine synthase
VLRSQVGTLAASLIMTVLLRPTSGIEAATTSLGLILLMATINMHLTAVSLSRASHGARAWVPRMVAAAAVVVVVGTVAMHWTDLTMASARGELGFVIDRLSSSGCRWRDRSVPSLPRCRQRSPC